MSTLDRRADRALIRDLSALGAAMTFVGLSYGAIAVAGGLPVWAIVAMSLLVFAGGAQFLAVGLVAAGNPVAAILGGLLLNARHLPFGLVVADVMSGEFSWSARARRGGARKLAGLGTRLLGSHLMVDESVAFALAQPDPARRQRAYWIAGVTVFVTWNAGTLAGIVLAGSVGDPDVLGLDAAFPAGLLALLMGSLRERRARRVALVGAAVAVLATPLLPAGLPVLLALVGVGVAWLSR